MQMSSVSKVKPRFDFDIGDIVCLRDCPERIGVVVARSLSENLTVLWDERAIELIDRRLLAPAARRV